MVNMKSNNVSKVGVIGAGNISSIYLKNCSWLTPVEVSAVADLRQEQAVLQSATFNVPFKVALRHSLTHKLLHDFFAIAPDESRDFVIDAIKVRFNC